MMKPIEMQNMTIHLLVQWYWPADPHRASELVRALAANLNNSHIDAIHLLQPPQRTAIRPGDSSPEHGPGNSNTGLAAIDDEPADADVVADRAAAVRLLTRLFTPARLLDPHFPQEALLRKVRPVRLRRPGRLRVGDALAYAGSLAEPPATAAGTVTRDRRATAVAVLANLDVRFDDSLGLLRTSPHSDLSPWSAYFLSRWEPEDDDGGGGGDAAGAAVVDGLNTDDADDDGGEQDADAGDQRLPSQCGPAFVGSHDAFVFVPPVPTTLARAAASLPLGAWGVEARLLWEFEQAGVRGRNPCEDVRVWHEHRGHGGDGRHRRRRWREVKVGVVAGVDAETWEAARRAALAPGADEAGNEWGEEEGEDEHGGDGRRPMPVVNTGGRSSIAFPDGLKARRPLLVDELWGRRFRPEGQ